MKKTVLLLVILLGFTANAQFSVGGGLAYMNDAGLEINSEFGIGEGMIVLSPSIDYYFTEDGVTNYAINVDGHYNLGDPDSTNYYPIAGLNYYYFSVDMPDEYEAYGLGDVSDGSVGLNLGFGASYMLSDAMKLYGEARFVMNDYADDFGIAVGVLFRMGE